MKKVFFTIAVLTIFCLVSCGATLKDVAPSHWAYEAVNFLVENGILSGMPDGTFKGNDYTTRYQTAVSIFRAIQYIKGISPNTSTTEGGEILDYKIESMQALVESMAKSMEKIGREYGIILDKMDSGLTGYNTDETENGELAALRLKVASAEKAIDDFRNFTASYNSEISVVKASINDNRNQISQLKTVEDGQIKKMEEMENRVNIMTWVSISALAIGIGGVVAGIIALNALNGIQQ